MTIDASEFDFISDLIRKESAIVLDKGKEYLVETRLSPIATQEGFENLSAMISTLQASKKISLVAKVVDALTTNETSFFRDIEPFEMLKEEIFPELINARKDEKKLTIWCGAASTGQELYSMAMIIRENFPELLNWDLTIIGTDISSEVLDKCRSGKYSQVEVNRGLPMPLLVKYFKKDGVDWYIKDELKKMIEFKELNLIRPFTLIPKCDLVMMRNVLIYFDTDVKKDILGKIRGVLRKDGYLFLGAAETTLNLDDNYERRSFKRGSCYTIKNEG